MPKPVLEGPLGKTATLQYSYRLNTGYAPRPDYAEDLGKMVQPFLLICGSADEPFHADEYEPLMSQYTDSGKYVVLDGVNHLELVLADQAIDEVISFLRK